MRIARIALFGVALWIAILGPSPARADALVSPTAATCTPASDCCKVCDKGYACGDSCISRTKQCDKGRGCSCNASEICAVG